MQSYREVLDQSQTINSGPEFEMVRRVASRLAKATGPAGSGFDWQESLIRDNQVNAFCLPGGKIVVYTGILPVAENEAALATVLGHEMAHATSRHGAQRVLQQNLTQTALTGIAVSLSDMDYNNQRAVMGALGVGAQFGVLMPFGREHESEADHVGLIYMARAGYDPRRAYVLGKDGTERRRPSRRSFSPVIPRMAIASSSCKVGCHRRSRNTAKRCKTDPRLTRSLGGRKRESGKCPSVLRCAASIASRDFHSVTSMVVPSFACGITGRRSFARPSRRSVRTRARTSRSSSSFLRGLGR